MRSGGTEVRAGPRGVDLVAEMLTIDPELEGLLREVAADPDSSLLKVPRQKQIRAFFDRGGARSTIESYGLTNIERHLLLAHRTELAHLLYQACLRQLVEGPRSRFFVSRFTSLDRELRIDTRLESRSVPIPLSEFQPPSDPDYLRGLELLEECATPADSKRPSVLDLASAGFALQRSDEFRLFASSELTQGPSLRTALLLLREVLQCIPTHSNAVSAWSQVGLAYSRLLNFERSHGAYAHLCTLDGSHIVGWLSRFLLAFQCGDRSDVRRVADRMSDAAFERHPAVDHFIQSTRRRRNAGEWSPTKAAADLLKRLSLEPETLVGRLASVLA